jgi:antitoxin component of MazEF toxin-antitoxin module
MSQEILKWGNGLAFRIPSAIARQMGLNEGAQVEFRIDGKRLVIEKADEVPAFTRENLVKALRMTKRDLIDFGGSRGKEIL